MVANRATHHIHRETTNRTTYPESLSRKMALSNRKLLSFGVFLLEVRTFFPKNIYCKLFFWLADVFGSKCRGCVAIKLVIQYVSYQKLHSNIEKIIFKRSFSFIFLLLVIRVVTPPPPFSFMFNRLISTFNISSIFPVFVLWRPSAQC